MPRLPLTVGTRIDDSEPALIDGARFNRHTFWCGQSGSGKTYALGVVLEQLLLETALPLLILDPNGDFVRLGEQRADAPAESAERLAARDVRVFRPRAEHDRLVVRLVEMDLASRAAVLRLDPVQDPEEFNVLRQLEAEFGPQDVGRLVDALLHAEQPDRVRLRRRIENLGLLEWDVWAGGTAGVESVIDERPDATVLDLGGFRERDEAASASLAVLDRLWNTRETRSPILIVIDEAHNICPPEAVSPVQRAVTERLIQIAAEGRKFGLWLLLSTQRPSKLHPQVLTQCDNLCVMKTNAPSDLDRLGRSFGGLSSEDLARIPQFAQGQALFAGGFAGGGSQFVQLGARLTPEGGVDVAVPPRA